MQNVATETAAEGRMALAGLMPNTGVVGSGDLAVAQNGTPNMSVNVAAGAVWMPGTQATYQGNYHGFNDATVNLAIATSDPTNPRIDIVVAAVQDAFYSGGSNQWVLQVVTGTPAPSPVAPLAPANSVTLAQVAVAANAPSIVNANITDKRPRAAALGGTFVTNSANLTSFAGYVGQQAYALDQGLYYTNTGANAWSVNPGQLITAPVLTTSGDQLTIAANVEGDSGVSLTFTMPALVGNRRVKITVFGGVTKLDNNETVNDIFEWYLTTSTNTHLWTQREVVNKTVALYSNPGMRIVYYATNSDFAAGTVTVKVRGKCPTGAMLINGVAGTPVIIAAETC